MFQRGSVRLAGSQAVAGQSILIWKIQIFIQTTSVECSMFTGWSVLLESTASRSIGEWIELNHSATFTEMAPVWTAVKRTKLSGWSWCDDNCAWCGCSWKFRPKFGTCNFAQLSTHRFSREADNEPNIDFHIRVDRLTKFHFDRLMISGNFLNSNQLDSIWVHNF